MTILIRLFRVTFMKLFWCFVLFIMLSISISGSSDDVLDFKDDYIGLYSSVKGQPIRYNSRKDLIEYVTEGMRIYLDDEINTREDQSVTGILSNHSYFFLGEQTHFKLEKKAGLGAFVPLMKHGMLRLFIPNQKDDFQMQIGETQLISKGGTLVADLYHNLAKNEVLNIAPLRNSILLKSKVNGKYNLGVGELLVIDEERLFKYKIEKSEFTKLVSGEDVYRYLFNVKDRLISKLEVIEPTLRDQKIAGIKMEDNYLLDTNFEMEKEVFSQNPYFQKVNKLLIYNTYNIGLKDIPIYKRYINEYVELEKKRKKIINDVSFVKKFYEELKNKKTPSPSSGSGSSVEIKMLREDYNKLIEDYSLVLFMQEDLAGSIDGLKQKHKLVTSQSRSPAQIEMEIEDRKKLIAKEQEAKAQLAFYESLRSYENEIQKIELILSRIRHAKNRIHSKQEFDRRELTLKEYAQVSLLEEAQKKLSDSRKYLVDQYKASNKKWVSAKVQNTLKSDLYDLGRSPASSWADNRNLLKSENALIRDDFFKIETKLKNEVWERINEFKADPAEDYKIKQKNEKRLQVLTGPN